MERSKRALDRRGTPRQHIQAWLDEYRWEHNYVRPHEALAMLTPATRWKASTRRYDPNPPRWEYPEGAWVLKVDCQGKVDIGGHKWKISRALRGEKVQVLAVKQRLLVYYCKTLMRELDGPTAQSTIVHRWISQDPKTGTNQRAMEKMETTARFPLPHSPDCGC